jgi:hypothetical protein
MSVNGTGPAACAEVAAPSGASSTTAPAARAKAESFHFPPSEPTRALSAKIAPGQAITIIRCTEPIPGQRQHSPPRSNKGQALEMCL